MSALPYLNIVGDVATVGLCLTLSINSFLIYLTHTHIEGITGAYKYMILLVANLGILFSSMEKLLHPFMHNYNISFVFFTISPVFGASKLLKTLLLLAYSVVYLLIICINTFQFIYRYLIVHQSKLVNCFQGRRAVWMLVYLVFFSAVWMYFPMHCLPDDYSISYLKTEMSSQYNASSDQVAGFFSVAYELTGSTRKWRRHAVMGAIALGAILFIQCTIMLFCGIKIHLKIKEMMTLTSKKDHRLQSQLFKTLVLQITAPSIFYHTPALFLFLAPFLDMEISVPSGVMVCFFSIYPALDSLILMWFVTEYHLVIGKLMEKFFERAMTWARSFSNRAADKDNDQVDNGDNN